VEAVSDARLTELVQALSPDGGGAVLLLDAHDASAVARAGSPPSGHTLVAVHGSSRSVRAAAGVLEAAGLAHRMTLVRTPRALVRLTAGDVGAVSEQLGITGRTAWVAQHLPPKLTTAALAQRSSSVVALCTRAGSAPPLGWLAPEGADGAVAAVAGQHGHTVSVRTSHGRRGGGLFAKWAAGPQGVEQLRREQSAIERFAPSAREAGFDVPAAHGVELPGGAFAVVFQARGGSTAAAELRSRPARLPRLTDTVISTVEAWNLHASVLKPFAATGAARRLDEDLQTLAGEVDTAAVRAAVEAAAGLLTPVAPAHGDLTMANVIVGAKCVTVVDWEAALAETLPGFDAEYALVDAAAAADGYRDRVGAARTAGVHAWRARLAATLGLPEPVARLTPVACWAHHAANELRKGGRDASFVTLLRHSLTEVSR
jgi:hypothetical protein